MPGVPSRSREAGPEALHPPVHVGERALLLGEGRHREHEVGVRGRGRTVLADVDEEGRVASEALGLIEQLVAEHDHDAVVRGDVVEPARPIVRADALGAEDLRALGVGCQVAPPGERREPLQGISSSA
jgi:hypothetical protein